MLEGVGLSLYSVVGDSPLALIQKKDRGPWTGPWSWSSALAWNEPEPWKGGRRGSVPLSTSRPPQDRAVCPRTDRCPAGAALQPARVHSVDVNNAAVPTIFLAWRCLHCGLESPVVEPLYCQGHGVRELGPSHRTCGNPRRLPSDMGDHGAGNLRLDLRALPSGDVRGLSRCG